MIKLWTNDGQVLEAGSVEQAQAYQQIRTVGQSARLRLTFVSMRAGTITEEHIDVWAGVEATILRTAAGAVERQARATEKLGIERVF